MRADRYLKVILTIIAVQLTWLCVRDLAPAVSAQPRGQEPTPVVIRGIEIPGQTRGVLQVFVNGSRDALPVEAVGVVRIGAQQAIPVEFEQPILVDVLPGRPQPRPGQ